MIGKKGIIVVVLVLIVVVLSTVFPTVTNRSEKELVKMTLESALVKKEIPDYGLIKDKNNVILSTENLDLKLIPTLPGINLVILSPSAIQEKANKEGDFLYLRFKKVDVGVFKSSISLDNNWIRSKDSHTLNLSGGGFTLRFYNVLGKWIESSIRERWIS